MQNVAIQAAKTAQVKQASNQNALANSGANLGADNVVDSVQNAFAELLKKQVTQQKTDAGEAVDNAQPTVIAQNKSVEIDTVAAVSAGLSDTTLTTKADADDKPEEQLPAIQDLIFMQMGLQPATAPNASKVNADAGAVGDEIELSGRADLAAAEQLQVTGNDIKSSISTDELAQNLADSSAKQTAFALDERAIARKEEPALGKAIVRDKEFNEIEIKSMPTTLPTVSTVVNKLPESVVATVAAASEIPTPFGKPEWNQAVNQRVMWMVGAGDQSATLTLNPPDLGPLQVVIQVENDQVDTTFISDNPEVRQALQDGMNMLRDKMQDSGMQLGNAQVSSQAQSQRQFEQAAQQRAQQRLEQGSQATANARESMDSSPVIQRVSNGLVDTFA